MQEHFHTAPDGAQIAYYITGSGAPLLCLHGSGRDKEQWVQAGWLPALAEHYTVIAPDSRGFGHSTVFHTEEGYALEHILGDITGLMAACGFERFRLFGHSYGATIGYQALRAGLPIERAVLASGSMSAHFFREVCPQEQAEYRTLADAKKAGTLAALPGYTPEDLAFIEGEDMEKFCALFGAWSRWQPVEPAELGGRAAIYSGSRDYNTEMVEATTAGRDALRRLGIETACFEGLAHEELITKAEICLPWVLRQLA